MTNEGRILEVTYDDIVSAARQIEGVAHRTPVVTSRTLDARLGATVRLKCENLQRMGAFKFRGAYNALSRLDDVARARGVIAYSSGNHAQAVALAGRLLGLATTIVMPSDAPAVKRRATEGYGARVVIYDPRTERREDVARRIAGDRGPALIPPFDHPHVIAGQGTAAKELFDEVGPLDLLLVPCGGGGLLSGSALAARALSPGCRVIGVEPEAGDDATRSFRTGVLCAVDNPVTIADGARTPSLGKLTFPLVRRHVDDMVTVSDEALLHALRFVWERLKLVVEPTAVLGLAAALQGKIDVAGRRVGVILSGGNVDIVAIAARLRDVPDDLSR
ncbi:threo-3-hydroxy-L-aspartate ammonia-lyase [Chondromyces apiculatus]|uniref:Threonine dehydratase, catabolic n=1 Tax=Chondromyces apiculatus DSM 436 TaxID=1192034 RepID=A0A017TIL1_9BACT|nr:threo-3-hydroxy-L-aspartate ammonia-lyase [Chondromyces apiculatus]EYF08461.1 Threonine dehydratase, catabolic [Chondromyces apiculatus DSM 436]